MNTQWQDDPVLRGLFNIGVRHPRELELLKSATARIERLQKIIDAAQGALQENAIVSASFILSRAAHGAKITGEQTQHEQADKLPEEK